MKKSCSPREAPVDTWPHTADSSKHLWTHCTHPAGAEGVQSTHCPTTQGTGVLCQYQHVKHTGLDNEAWPSHPGPPDGFTPWAGDGSKCPRYLGQFWWNWRVSWEGRAPLDGETCLVWGCEGLAQLWYGPVSQSTALFQYIGNQNSWFLGNQINSTEVSAASKSLSTVPS